MERPSLHEESERIKRRRLNEAGLLVGEDASRALILEAASASGLSADGGNADFASLVMRRRLQAGANADPTGHGARLASSVSLQQQIARSSEASSFLGNAAGSTSSDISQMLRHTWLSQQLQSTHMRAADDGVLSSYLGAPEGPSPASLCASLLNGRGGNAAALSLSSFSSPNAQLANSLLMEQALQTRAVAGGAGSSNLDTLAEQLLARQSEQEQLAGASNIGGVGASASYLQLLEEQQHRELEADQLLQLLGVNAPASVGAGSFLARMQNERALLDHRQAAAAGMGLPLHSFLAPRPRSNNQVAGPGVGGGPVGIHRDLLLSELQASRGAGGALQNYFGASVPGSAAAGRLPDYSDRSPLHAGGGRQPMYLYMSCDEDDLSPYQCLVRQQIELFEAQEDDAETNARGRNRPIVVGQVGIRCKHCKMLPPRKRERAAIYYPSKLDRLYQAGQTMASVHLGQHCSHIPDSIRKELARLREGKSAALGGKKYWSDGARALGVTEEDERLCFR